MMERYNYYFSYNIERRLMEQVDEESKIAYRHKNLMIPYIECLWADLVIYNPYRHHAQYDNRDIKYRDIRYREKTHCKLVPL